LQSLRQGSERELQLLTALVLALLLPRTNLRLRGSVPSRARSALHHISRNVCKCQAIPLDQ
jgi:hypothetical protein